MNIGRFVPVIIVVLTVPTFASSASERDAGQSQHASHAADMPSAFIAKVQEATRRFRDIKDVNELTGSGYEQFLGCVSGPQEGAMGVHFVNATLAGNGELDANQPEALIYELKNGGIRLVGVEYIVDAEAWHANHKEPPVLEGQLLQYNGSPNRFGLAPFYELHVWAWRDNPNGAFVDWNPRVSCEGQ
jgi:hypothetical protein